MTLFNTTTAEIPLELRLKRLFVPPHWQDVARSYGLYDRDENSKLDNAFSEGGWVGTPAQWEEYEAYIRGLDRATMTAQQRRHHTNALKYISVIPTVTDDRHAGDIENDIAAFRLEHSAMTGEAYDRMRQRNSEKPGTTRCGVCYRPLLEPSMIIKTSDGGDVRLGPTCARWWKRSGI